MTQFENFPIFPQMPVKKYSGYPFCDVLFNEDNQQTTLRLAVAGYSKDMLDVSKEKNVLIVSGSAFVESAEEKATYRERNIKRSPFVRVFDLKDGSYVESVKLEDGILEIVLKVEIPESHKRQSYVIHQE